MKRLDVSPLWLPWNAKRRYVKALHTLRDPNCLNQFNLNLHSLHLNLSGAAKIPIKP